MSGGIDCRRKNYFSGGRLKWDSSSREGRCIKKNCKPFKVGHHLECCNKVRRSGKVEIGDGGNGCDGDDEDVDDKQPLKCWIWSIR